MEYELYHHGVKGMKWGVRRYQNEDGTRTEAGKKRYRYDASTSGIAAKSGGRTKKPKERKPFTNSFDQKEMGKETGKMSAEKKYRNAKRDIRSDRVGSVRDAFNDTSNAVNRVKQINDRYSKPKVVKNRLDLSHMTDQELRNAINRELLERQYNDLFATETIEVSNGRKTVGEILDVAGDVATIGGSIASIAYAISRFV